MIFHLIYFIEFKSNFIFNKKGKSYPIILKYKFFKNIHFEKFGEILIKKLPLDLNLT